MKDSLYCIQEPDGFLVFTMIATEPEECIDMFMKEGRLFNWIANLGRADRNERLKCADSWEAYESRGFSVVKCKVVKDED